MAYDTESALRWMDEDLYDEYKKKEIRDSVPSLPERSRRFSTSDMNISDARNLIAWEQKEGEDIKVGGIRPTAKMQGTMPTFSPVPTPKAPSVDSLPSLPEPKRTSIADMMSEAYQASRKAVEKQRSSDLAIARMRAMSDVFGNLLTPVAWKIGGGGDTSFTNPIKQDNSGYIEAFNRARQASDKLINLDAEYQNSLTHYAIDQEKMREAREYQQKQTEEQRKWNAEEAEAERQWREAQNTTVYERQKEQAEAERQWRENQANSQHQQTLKEIEHRNKYPSVSVQRYEKDETPRNFYYNDGNKLTFSNQDEMDDFYNFAKDFMSIDDLNEGVDGTMTPKEEQAQRLANVERYIKQNAESLYNKWKGGTAYKPTAIPAQANPLSLSGINPLFSPPNDSMRIDTPAAFQPRIPQNPQDDEDFGLKKYSKN